jgi:NAD-dependent dihydropyrimidine dehydrogenase PreA subunit
MRKGSAFVFGEVTSLAEMTLDYPKTILPLKKFLTKPSEPILTFSPSEVRRYHEDLQLRRKVFFAVHSCDAHALQVLDSVFLGDYPDPLYVKRREGLIVVALTCNEPAETCFCASMGTGPSLSSGYDILMTDLGAIYLLEPGSSAGRTLLREALDKVPGARTATTEDFDAKDRLLSDVLTRFKLSIRTDGLPEVLMKRLDHSIWERYGDICLACGQCVLVCPTCYCFDIRDHSLPSQESGERIREWDCCVLLEFAEVAMGGNFRRDRGARLRQFIGHNLSYCIKQFSQFKCVGCGRCIEACPVHINIAKIAKELQEA